MNQRKKRKKKGGLIFHRNLLIFLCLLLLLSPAAAISAESLESEETPDTTEITIDEVEENIEVTEEENELQLDSKEAVPESNEDENNEPLEIKNEGSNPETNETAEAIEKNEKEDSSDNDESANLAEDSESQKDQANEENEERLETISSSRQLMSSGNDFDYTINADNTLTITGYNGTDIDVVIPEVIDGKTVTIIGENAFKQKGLTSVVLPDTIKIIQRSAFEDNGLEQIALPEGLQEILREAFMKNKLKSLTIPDSVHTMIHYTFSENEITEVQFGTGLTSIGTGIFRENKLTHVDIPAHISSINSQSFMYNEDLVQVTIHNDNASITDNAFKDNRHNPASLTIIGHDGSTAEAHALSQGYTFIAFSEPIPGGNVTIIYVDEDEIEIASPEILTGFVGEDYATIKKDIADYTFKEVIGSATGKFTDEEQVIKYVYTKDKPAEPDKVITAPVYDSIHLKIGWYDITDLPFPNSVKVSLDDGSKVDLEVIWSKISNPDYEKDTPGNYLFSGEFVLKDGITNPNNHLPQRVIVLTEAVVNVAYEDEDGNKLTPDVTLTGKLNQPYTTEEKTFEGYTLSKVPTNATGTFGQQDTQVTYLYTKDSTDSADKEITGAFSLVVIYDVNSLDLTGVRSLLPGKVKVELDDNTEMELDTTNWTLDSTPAYQKDKAGLYTFYADIELPDGIKNSANIKAKFAISLVDKEQPSLEKTEIISVPIIGTAYEVGTTELADVIAEFPSKVEVEIADGSLVELEVNWNQKSNPAYDKDLVGRYIFTGELVLTDGITNQANHQIEYWVNLIDISEQDDPALPNESVTPEKPTKPEKPNGKPNLEEPRKQGNIKDSNSNKVVKNKPAEIINTKDSHLLPKTTTSYHTVGLIGLILLMIGAITYTIHRRKRQA